MNFKTLMLISLCMSLTLSFYWMRPIWGQEQKSVESSADAEKEKAMKNPYPNDFGPDKIDVSKYPAELQAGYKLTLEKCSKCHTASRVLNSQFVEIKEDEIAKLKTSQAEIFKDKLLWQVESGIWQRYVKRMMAKPGCNISSEEGKKIWKFVVEDSKQRKTGSASKNCRYHRTKLLADFKLKHPERHKELFGK